MNRPTMCVLILILALNASPLQSPAATPPATRIVIDSNTVAHIVTEETRNSRVREILESLTSTCGPRLTWSPGFMAAVSWAEQQLRESGIPTVYTEHWGPTGRGWTIARYHASVIAPVAFPLISYPKAWSPPTPGKVSGKVILLNAESDSALQQFKGRIRDAFVLLGTPTLPDAHWTPEASRLDDATLLRHANSDGATRIPPRRRRISRARYDPQMEYARRVLCVEEGAAAILTPSEGDGGSVIVESALGIAQPGTIWTAVPPAYSASPPGMLPQVSVAAEHFNRLARLVQAGHDVLMEMSLETNEFEADSGTSVFGEIPGTDLRHEVVMIGAHLDSWHGGTGATDNGAGVAVCLEAIRLISTLPQRPRRTIRCALWGGEEQGSLGSRAFVHRHLGERRALPDTGRDGPGMFGPVRYTPEADSCAVYFNLDGGSGRIRGIALEGNAAAGPLVKSWCASLQDPSAITLSMDRTSSSDHVAFTEIGLPAFHFVQDDLEYSSRSWHSTMDTLERISEEDLRQASIVLALLAYSAASGNEHVPRTLQQR